MHVPHQAIVMDFVLVKGDSDMLDSIMTLQGLFDANRAESYVKQTKIKDFFKSC